MSPYQHGEVYVTDDGAETDLDLGHYERFTNSVTTRQPQLDHRQDLPVGHPEGAPRRLSRPHRAGDSAHHQRDQGQHPRASSQDVDIVLVEIGGTVGDIESLPFLEAIRQFRQDVGRENTLYIHLTLVPFIGTAGELKTKPTQHSVRDLRSIGIQPDILLCRTDRFLPSGHQAEDRALLRRRRGSGHHREGRRDASTRCRWCSPPKAWTRIVLQAPSACPQTERRMDAVERAGRSDQESDRRDHDPRRRQVRRLRGFVQEPQRGAVPRRVRASAAREHQWIEAEALEQPTAMPLLDGADGILVPGGFGDRGTRGMMRAAQIAREQRIPYFGICYGFQWAAVEYARNVCGLEDADSTECSPDTPSTR